MAWTKGNRQCWPLPWFSLLLVIEHMKHCNHQKGYLFRKWPFVYCTFMHKVNMAISCWQWRARVVEPLYCTDEHTVLKLRTVGRECHVLPHFQGCVYSGPATHAWYHAWNCQVTTLVKSSQLHYSSTVLVHVYWSTSVKLWSRQNCPQIN